MSYANDVNSLGFYNYVAFSPWSAIEFLFKEMR